MDVLKVTVGDGDGVVVELPDVPWLITMRQLVDAALAAATYKTGRREYVDGASRSVVLVNGERQSFGATLAWSKREVQTVRVIDEPDFGKRVHGTPQQ